MLIALLSMLKKSDSKTSYLYYFISYSVKIQAESNKHKSTENM